VHPLVVTIHDVSYERHPEWYPYRKDHVRRWFYRRSALSADLVITDSEFSRKEIEAAYGIAADRIRVVPLAVGVPFTAVEPSHSWLPPKERFILHVGDLHPRRNVGVLVDALGLLRARADDLRHTVLVLVGADRGSAAAIAAQAQALGIAGALRFVNNSTDDQVVELMRGASAFAYPSLYEGFGLPALEAMACGRAVICSHTSALPEVVDGAAILFDPYALDEIARAMADLLLDGELRLRMERLGLQRAAHFSWQKTAQRTLSVFHDVLEKSRATSDVFSQTIAHR
jgi:alpha-1,3-rhamnosyl/mannosyltransferase